MYDICYTATKKEREAYLESREKEITERLKMEMDEIFYGKNEYNDGKQVKNNQVNNK